MWPALSPGKLQEGPLSRRSQKSHSPNRLLEICASLYQFPLNLGTGSETRGSLVRSPSRTTMSQVGDLSSEIFTTHNIFIIFDSRSPGGSGGLPLHQRLSSWGEGGWRGARPITRTSASEYDIYKKEDDLFSLDSKYLNLIPFILSNFIINPPPGDVLGLRWWFHHGRRQWGKLSSRSAARYERGTANKLNEFPKQKINTKLH